MRRHIFISYATADEKAAEATCKALEGQGFKCWMAPRKIKPGTHYGEAIAAAIAESRAFVLLLSSKSNESEFVERELERATTQKVPIVTFAIEKVTPSRRIELFVSNLQWVNAYSKPLEQHFPNLIEAIKTGVTRQRPLAPARNRRTTIIIAAVVCAVGWIIYHSFQTPWPPITAFAILPMKDHSGSPGLEYLGDGISEQLSRQLSALREIKVIPSKALFGFSDSMRQFSRVGKIFKVDAVLDGHVSRQGDNLFLSASLIETETGRARWQQNYQRAMAAIPATVSEISNDVARTLNASLPDSVLRTPPRDVAGSQGAYDSYLKGRYYKKKGTAADNGLAIEYFQDALRQDSAYVPALVGLADAQEYHVEQRWTSDAGLLEWAERNAKAALALDSINAGATAVLGAIQELRGNAVDALGLYKKANERDPTNTLVLTRMALLFFNQAGDPTIAIKCLKTVEEIEPFNTDNRLNLGVMYAMSRQYKQALDAFRSVVELRPDQADYWHNLGYYYERVGERDSAMHAYQCALNLDNSRGDTYLSCAALAVSQGDFAKAESLLIRGKTLLGHVRITYALGCLYAATTRKDDAQRIYGEGLALLESRIKAGQAQAGDYALQGLFLARLGERKAAITSVLKGESLVQSSDDVVFIDIARVYALLGNREKVMIYFGRAHGLQPLEYDEYFLKNTLDFENYRTDPRMLAIAAG